jgi:hypothetical protein
VRGFRGGVWGAWGGACGLQAAGRLARCLFASPAAPLPAPAPAAARTTDCPDPWRLPSLLPACARWRLWMSPSCTCTRPASSASPATPRWWAHSQLRRHFARGAPAVPGRLRAILSACGTHSWAPGPERAGVARCSAGRPAHLVRRPPAVDGQQLRGHHQRRPHAAPPVWLLARRQAPQGQVRRGGAQGAGAGAGADAGAAAPLPGASRCSHRSARGAAFPAAPGAPRSTCRLLLRPSRPRQRQPPPLGSHGHPLARRRLRSSRRAPAPSPSRLSGRGGSSCLQTTTRSS